MQYWWREVGGWALVIIGLLMLAACALFAVSQRVIEAGLLTMPGIFVYRGGIHLLKVAVAARVCTEAAADMARKTVRST